MKTIKLLATIIAIFISQAAFSAEVDNYPETLDKFYESFRQSVTTDFLPSLESVTGANETNRVLTESLLLLQKETTEYKDLYIRAMINGEGKTDKSLNRQLYSFERRLKYYYARLALHLVEFEQTQKGANALTDKLAVLNETILAKKEVASKISETQRTILPFRTQSTKTALKYAFANLINQDLTTMVDKMSTAALLPQGKDHTPVFRTHTNDNKSKPGFQVQSPQANDVTVVTINHDHALYDIKLTYSILREKFGAKNSEIFLVTTKAAWPKFHVYGNKEPNIFLIEDTELTKNIVEKISQTEGRAFLIVAPEGAQTQWSIQFPTLAKPGAFAIASALAKNIQDKKISYLELQNNLAAFVADERVKNLLVDVYEPQIVDPTDKSWAQRMRLRFQEHLTKFRNQIVNLAKPELVPQSRIYKVKPRPVLNQCVGIF